MTNPLATVHAISRFRPAAEALAKPATNVAPEDAFAPQLARACERGQFAAASPVARGEIAPISDAAGASALRLWEARPAEESAPATAEQGESSDQDPTDEQPALPTDENASEKPSVSTAQSETPLLVAAPLVLRLAGASAFAAEAGEPGDPDSAAAQLAEFGEPSSKPARTSEKDQQSKPEASGTVESGKPGSEVSSKAEAAKTASPKLASETPSPGTPPSKPAQAQAKDQLAGLDAGASTAAGAPGQADTSPDGTSVASLTQPMTAVPEMNKTALSDEQNLPSGTAALHLVAEKIASRMLSATHTASSGTGDQVVQIAGPAQPGPEIVAKAELVTPVTAVDQVEKVAALIASAVVRMRQRGEDDFEVSIRPDQDTEILLRVNLQSGNAEVQAELRRGDNAAFAANWRELQDRLAQQGMKLADLTAGEQQTETSGQHSDASSKRQPEQQQEAAPFGYSNTSTNPEPARSAGSKTTASPVLGWETWA